jgi:protein-L-isoaspartate O-methyltransferase
MEPGRTPSQAPTLQELESLAESPDIRDRAFVASALVLQRNTVEAWRIARVYERIRTTARTEHAELQASIRRGELDAAALERRLTAVAPELRDHFIEELLDVAYPPLAHDVTRNSPSGLAEVRFMLEHGRLAPGRALVDLGSGLGKVVLLTALLTGARACGIELDSRLVEHARAAAAHLRLDRAQFVVGDIREAPLPEADVYYLFIPFSGSAQVVERLAPIAARRPFLLFSQALELGQTPWLRATGRACYWLQMYEVAR